MPTDVHVKPKKESTDQPSLTRPWVVILFNDDIHSFDEVILQLQKAIACSVSEATKITMEAHFKGKAPAFRGHFSKCNEVAGVLREIGLVVEIHG